MNPLFDKGATVRFTATSTAAAWGHHIPAGTTATYQGPTVNGLHLVTVTRADGSESQVVRVAASEIEACNTEARTFAPGEGTSAMFFDIEMSGRGATMKVERTPEGGWQSVAAFADDARVEFFNALQAKGFAGYHSGGGCRAMSREFGDGGNQFQILITGEDAEMPEPGAAWLVGCYDPDGDFFDSAEGQGDAELLAAVDRLVAAMESRIASESDETRAKRDADHAALIERFR